MTGKQKLFYFISLHRTGLWVTALSLVLLLFPLVENNPYTLGITNLIAIHVDVEIRVDAAEHEESDKGPPDDGSSEVEAEHGAPFSIPATHVRIASSLPKTGR